jgi:hypothetical protein
MAGYIEVIPIIHRDLCMIHAFYLTFLITVLTGCSSTAAPTSEPSPPSPTLSPAVPTALFLPTLNPAVTLLQPNQQYPIFITFSESFGDVVNIHDGFSNQIVASFTLKRETGDPENPRFAMKGRTTGAEWGMLYVVHAVNVQTAEWERPYSSIQGVLLLSPNGQRIAYSLCNEYGGRGQFCSASRLWLFDIMTGEGQQLNLEDSGLIFAYDLAFSDDSQNLTGEGCLSYANAYFGYCGVTAVSTWDVRTGDMLDTAAISATVTPAVIPGGF